MGISGLSQDTPAGNAVKSSPKSPSALDRVHLFSSQVQFLRFVRILLFIQLFRFGVRYSRESNPILVPIP
ncbi:hypothetical protein BFN03_18105 [Rhodococcus sp. WMMA185]|nr:hypothetical protein BFN03_18105 [Rhodococcus sp. WMMA185]